MIHQPVLVEEVIALFKPQGKDRLLDATIGNGGHTRAFLEAAGSKATAVGIDADPEALETAKEQLKEFGDRVTYHNQNFVTLNNARMGGGIVEEGERSLQTKSPGSFMQTPNSAAEFTHIVFDLGIGTHQLAGAGRGFSFKEESQLDMRYGRNQTLPPADVSALNNLAQHLGHYPNAAELIQELAPRDLETVLRQYGEERYAGRIAKALHQKAYGRGASEVADIVVQATPSGYEHGRIHPATRTFQALRLAVNRELEVLRAVLPEASELLAENGTVGVISFHSLEDRIVKQFLRANTSLEVLTKKPITASQEEVRRNPRARSAKLRAARKIGYTNK